MVRRRRHASDRADDVLAVVAVGVDVLVGDDVVRNG
jgi:hypothetical protein